MDLEIESICYWLPVDLYKSPEALGLLAEVARDCILKVKAYGIINVGDSETTPNEVTYKSIQKDLYAYARKEEEVLYIQILRKCDEPKKEE